MPPDCCPNVAGTVSGYFRIRRPDSPEYASNEGIMQISCHFHFIPLFLHLTLYSDTILTLSTASYEERKGISLMQLTQVYVLC